MSAEVIFSIGNIDPRRDEGYLIVKIGEINAVVDGKRIASMLWGNVKGGISDALKNSQIYGRQNGAWKGNLMPLPITAASKNTITEDGHTHEYEGVVIKKDDPIVVIDDGETPVTTIVNGYLYPFLAIQDSRGLTASNAHVPTDDEWHTLSLALDPATDINEVQNYSLVAGGMLLEGGSTGFNAKYSGIRDTDGDATGYFTGINQHCFFWTSTQYTGQPYGWIRSVINENLYENHLQRNAYHDTCGFSIRLIVDTPIEISGSHAIYVGNDLQRYNCKMMPDGKWWTIENLLETKWRNGVVITEVKENAAWLALTTGDARCAYVNIETNAKVIVGGPVDVLPGGTVIITRKLANMIPDADHVTVTDAEKATWNAKQAAGNYITVEAADLAYAPISAVADFETFLDILLS